MAKRKSKSTNEHTDVTKRPIALWLPYVITGFFAIIVALIPIWCDRDAPDRPIRESTFEKCKITTQMTTAIELIDKYKSSVNKDDRLFLAAIKEKFESDLKNPDICSDQKKTRSIIEELKTINEILLNE